MGPHAPTEFQFQSEDLPRFRCRRFRGGQGAVHVAVGGELDVAAVPQLDGALRRAWSTADVIVLDLRDADHVDACGADLIVEADRRIRRAGGHLVVVRGPADVDWFFELIGLDLVLDLVEQPPAAGTGCGPDLLRSGYPGADQRRISA